MDRSRSGTEEHKALYQFLRETINATKRQETLLTNEAIKAKTVMLVVQKADNTTETTVVSRKQALEAARIANLDLVQVNGKANPVVCRLMDVKLEDYRRKKLAKVTVKRKQQQKEIRMKGMIASHDFERKLKDVMKYLERGDVVKVVFEAPPSVLRRSVHCLDDLQTKFEEQMEEAAVWVRPSEGGNKLYRREFTCSPKSTKGASGGKQSQAKEAAARVKPPSTVLREGLDEQLLERLRGSASSEMAEDPDDVDAQMSARDEDGVAAEGADVGEEHLEVWEREETKLWAMEDLSDFGEEDEVEMVRDKGRGKVRSADPLLDEDEAPRASRSKGTGRKIAKKKGSLVDAGVAGKASVVDDFEDDIVDMVDDDFRPARESKRREGASPGGQGGVGRPRSRGGLKGQGGPSRGEHRGTSVDGRSARGRQVSAEGSNGKGGFRLSGRRHLEKVAPKRQDEGGGTRSGETQDPRGRGRRLPPPVRSQEPSWSADIIDGQNDVDATAAPANAGRQYRWSRGGSRDEATTSDESEAGAGTFAAKLRRGASRTRLPEARARLPQRDSSASSRVTAEAGARLTDEESDSDSKRVDA